MGTVLPGGRELKRLSPATMTAIVIDVMVATPTGANKADVVVNGESFG